MSARTIQVIHVTKDQKHISVDDMTEAHVFNSLNHLFLHYVRDRDFYKHLISLLNKTSIDHAQPLLKCTLLCLQEVNLSLLDHESLIPDPTTIGEAAYASMTDAYDPDWERHDTPSCLNDLRDLVQELKSSEFYDVMGGYINTLLLPSRLPYSVTTHDLYGHL